MMPLRFEFQKPQHQAHISFALSISLSCARQPLLLETTSVRLDPLFVPGVTKSGAQHLHEVKSKIKL